MTTARICEKGHAVLTNDKFCTQCGALVLDGCPLCGHPFPDYRWAMFDMPQFCGGCGQPLPWHK